MKTITTPLSQKERTTRNLALISLLCLPLYLISAGLISIFEADLARVLFITFIILNLTLAIVAGFTRQRAPAFVALLMPFASIPITLLGILFAAADSMRLY